MKVYDEKKINQCYFIAKEVYSEYGVDTEKVINKMKNIPVSIHCWQGDDVTGFEGHTGLSGGGILATGNYPGRARNGEELRRDIDKAMSLIPGSHRVNLHAIYAETNGKKVERDQLTAEYFKNWIDWAKSNGIGLDFNPTFFSHKMADKGYTLSSADEKTRNFWIEHGKRCREIGEEMGKQLGSACVNNIWIPDGTKDIPASRLNSRKILKDSLDKIFEIKHESKYILDSIECKLFGIGSESYVVGSHEFYMGYAMKNDVMLCLDAGHFHPTETVSDKISSIFTFQDKLLLHVSRPVRWDSDHVVLFNDETIAILQEAKRCDALGNINFALDFFDASINRITAWVTGTRAFLKALMFAMLEPTELIMKAESEGNFGNRLALMEEFKTLPFAAVWNRYCQENSVPVGTAWLDDIDKYEREVLFKRI